MLQQLPGVAAQPLRIRRTATNDTNSEQLPTAHLSEKINDDQCAPRQRRVKHILVFQLDQGGYLALLSTNSD